MSSPLILGYDGIDNLGITHLSRSNKFAFQSDLNPEDFRKADLRIISSISIPAHCGMPVRLGTSIGKDQPMPNGLKAVSTVASLDFPSLFALPGLVCPEAQGCATILLQNCGDSQLVFFFHENGSDCCLKASNDVKTCHLAEYLLGSCFLEFQCQFYFYICMESIPCGSCAWD